MPVGKKWYYSKTVWANVIMIISSVVMDACGVEIDPKLQAAFLTIANFVLRLVTKEKIEW